MTDSDKVLVVFQGKKIRRTWFNDEWWFHVDLLICQKRIYRSSSFQSMSTP